MPPPLHPRPDREQILVLPPQCGPATPQGADARPDMQHLCPGTVQFNDGEPSPLLQFGDVAIAHVEPAEVKNPGSPARSCRSQPSTQASFDPERRDRPRPTRRRVHWSGCGTGRAPECCPMRQGRTGDKSPRWRAGWDRCPPSVRRCAYRRRSDAGDAGRSSTRSAPWSDPGARQAVVRRERWHEAPSERTKQVQLQRLAFALQPARIQRRIDRIGQGSGCGGGSPAPPISALEQHGTGARGCGVRTMDKPDPMGPQRRRGAGAGSAGKGRIGPCRTRPVSGVWSPRGAAHGAGSRDNMQTPQNS